MTHQPEYHVVILPEDQPAARHCTLREALAFQQGYHEVPGNRQRSAVIGLEAEPVRAENRPAMAASATSRRVRPGYSAQSRSQAQPSSSEYSAKRQAG